MPSILHRVLRRLAKVALITFYSEVRVVGEDNVPEDGPLVVVSTHHNMMVDPAVLSCAFPHKRQLHYWAKSSLFANPAASYILKLVGQIPVDRKSKDNASLFQGTFEALADGEAIAVFPEGTSYTECRIMQVKDGAAWATLEYLKWASDKTRPGAKPPKVIVAGISYTNKSKYRSRAILEFSRPLDISAYEHEFMSDGEGCMKSATKKLTRMLADKMAELTINAPDWETLFAARTARDLLWPDTRSINPDDFVHISQTLIDLFLTPHLGNEFTDLKHLLVQYDSLLRSSRFTSSDLAYLPLPTTLDPNRDIPTPNRVMTLIFLIRDTIAMSIRLPFFVFPLIIHLPAYLVGRLGGSLVEDEEETQAQNKLIFGLILTLTSYSIMFAVLWTFFRRTAVGAMLAFGTVWAMWVYHRQMIDDNYEHAKRLAAAWRVLVGVWYPKRFDVSTSKLAEYSKPFIPPMSPYIGRTLPNKQDAAASSSKRIRPRGPPSRKLVRHVLRARVMAAKALAACLVDLERANVNVRASAHLARIYGGTVDPPTSDQRIEVEDETENNGSLGDPGQQQKSPKEGVLPAVYPSGWRSGREVVKFLRSQGANVGMLRHGGAHEDDWAVISSEDATGADTEESIHAS